jgi:hypothetical protein
MRARAALLCDAATVREGLLHVLGGGITRLWRDQLPAALNVTMAFMLEVEQEHLGSLVEVGVLIKDPDGDAVIEVNGSLQPEGGRLEHGEVQLLPMVLPLGAGGVQRYGRYSAEITLDGVAQDESLTFWVLHPVEQELPAL